MEPHCVILYGLAGLHFKLDAYTETLVGWHFNSGVLRLEGDWIPESITGALAHVVLYLLVML